jgi:hypothetical protein
MVNGTQILHSEFAGHDRLILPQDTEAPTPKSENTLF